MSWQDVHEMVTAVGYGRDAARAAVGTMRGKCRFYAAGERTGLEYEAQLGMFLCGFFNFFHRNYLYIIKKRNANVIFLQM